jgi:hypothetical protein
MIDDAVVPFVERRLRVSRNNQEVRAVLGKYLISSLIGKATYLPINRVHTSTVWITYVTVLVE